MNAAAMRDRAGWLWWGILFSALSARAQAPVPSQEFWSYLVEFGDSQGELFDPADYAAVANIPAKASANIEKASDKTLSAPKAESVTMPVVEEQAP